MTLLTLGLYLPLWFCYGLAQPPFLDSFDSFPGNDIVFVCVRVRAPYCTSHTVLCMQHRCRGAGTVWLLKHFEL